MSKGAGHRPPLSLVIPAGVVVALLQLPLVYLAVRALGGGEAWEILWRARTLELVVSTGLLVLGVTAASIVIGVALAWLVTRTDLPGRRLWGVAAALPLVIPSYVAALVLLGAFGPRGLVQEALGVEQLPDIRGYWGALIALTLATYPYVYLLCASALRGQDPALEDAARGLGALALEVVLLGHGADAEADDWRRCVLVALYVLSDFGVVSLMNYDALTRAIFLQYRALFDRTPAAVLALLLVALTALVLLIEAWTRRAGSLLPLVAGPGTNTQDGAAGSVALPGARLLRAHGRPVPRAPCRRARLLARPGNRARARSRLPVG